MPAVFAGETCMPCLYHQRGDLFEPTEYARSPWHPDLLHGGPVAALFGYHLARWPGTDGFQLSRLSLTMLRPVPRAPLAMVMEPVREGRRMKMVALSLYAGDNLVARGEGLWQKKQPVQLPDHAPVPEPPPAGPEGIAPFSIQQMLDDKGLAIPSGFHTHVQVRPVTPWDERGQSTAWLHWPAQIVDQQAVTPLEQACMLSDLGNGTGQLNYGAGVGTINADIVLTLSRDPTTDWIALSSRAQCQPQGTGVVHSQVFDSLGAIGYVLQSVQPNREFNG